MSMLDWLYGLQSIGIKLGLENMRRLLAELPTPRTPPLTIHVAGTNGKGSVCAFMDAIARAHGLKTGLFTSPHLVRFQERIRVNGETIPDKDMDRWLSHLREIVSDWDPHPSFFEITLALAIAHFYEQQIECLLLETGLGGRLDATNALEPRHVSVITPIHYDHTHILGKTLDAIAREKAGIFRAGIPIVSALQLPEAERALKQAADAIQAPIRFVRAPY
ncbi:MAG: dihydrofolate synthase/folylpolyglutamate synthase, partial [Verrucomicrobiales bacterium]